jgi:hypothetical protein
MRSGVGSGKVLGFGAGSADAEDDAAPADAAAEAGAAERAGAALAPGSPWPSAKCAGKTSDGAPGSVEKRAVEQARAKTSGAAVKARARRES